LIQGLQPCGNLVAFFHRALPDADVLRLAALHAKIRFTTLFLTTANISSIALLLKALSNV
jgi:hypothetical protein